ncbi:OmpA domain protein [Psychromonas ingrahamii 37]|uniref:Peptidoglycan-associated lipoprotein n=1 Tax=Psychromonas ingrahamii (strain DSM 17664 / CCUG 51855 / 37) TaxID=357804 RepID=A1SSW5_PSYIN|nr:peptidoglycan-associated lipoprotein Pal [Psychromonas ingrahamii]ABM02580.1 OmpA domain protein [Psychromonas ingrahamii 37]
MKLSMISKSLLIALPLLALSACSSKSYNDSAAMEANKAAMEQAAMDKAAMELAAMERAAEENKIETDGLQVVELTEEELMAQQYSDAILQKTIQFDFDTSMIKPEFTSILDAHAKFLVNNPSKKVTIEGHTDEKGTPGYNIALSERRAMSVSVYLENMGVLPDQISVVSYGEEKPLNFGHSEASWADNRRAELVY